MYPTHQSENVTQICLFRWAKYMEGQYPELHWMYHVPNEGKRTRSAGARMRQEGLKAGVPDVCLPLPRAGYHGLYIEMKVDKNKPTEKQKEWLAGLKAQGYATTVCYGWEAASNIILGYLKENAMFLEKSEAQEDKIDFLEVQIRRTLFYLRHSENDSGSIRKAQSILHEALEQEENENG